MTVTRLKTRFTFKSCSIPPTENHSFSVVVWSTKYDEDIEEQLETNLTVITSVRVIKVRNFPYYYKN